MKRRIALWMILGVSAATLAFGQDFPKVDSFEPEAGKVGDEATAKGDNLGKSKVGELYLTDGKNDILLGTLNGHAYLVLGRPDLATNHPLTAEFDNVGAVASAPFAAGADVNKLNFLALALRGIKGDKGE